MKVLIASVSAGSGHMRAAQALQAAFERVTPWNPVEHVDVMKYATGSYRRLYTDGYEFTVQHMPSMWGRAFRYLERRRDPSWVKGMFGRIQRRQFEGFFDHINRTRPDTIIATHFLIPQILHHQFLGSSYSPRIECVVTDFRVHRVWAHEAVDQYYVACQRAAEELEDWGIPAHKISVTGIPIDPLFGETVSRIEVIKRLGLRPGIPTILIMTGGAGLHAIEKAITQIFKIKLPVQIIAVAGRNKKLQRRLTELNVPEHAGLSPLGFVNNIHELMSVSEIVITKAGGLTVSEALTKGNVMVFFGSIPGQEEGNAEYITSQRAGLKALNLLDLKSLIHQLLVSPRMRAELRSNAFACATPRAGVTIAEKTLLYLAAA